MFGTFVSVETDYDMRVEEGDDPVHDPPTLRRYMDRHDGEPYFNALGHLAVLRVLETGIGTGRLAARVLAHQPAPLTGLHLSQKSLDTCRRNFADEGRPHPAMGVFPRWHTSERYDATYSSLTFMHIGHLPAALRKAAFFPSANWQKERLECGGVMEAAQFPRKSRRLTKYFWLGTSRKTCFGCDLSCYAYPRAHLTWPCVARSRRRSRTRRRAGIRTVVPGDSCPVSPTKSSGSRGHNL